MPSAATHLVLSTFQPPPREDGVVLWRNRDGDKVVVLDGVDAMAADTAFGLPFHHNDQREAAQESYQTQHRHSTRDQAQLCTNTNTHAHNHTHNPHTVSKRGTGTWAANMGHMYTYFPACHAEN